jgi:hypothetical protein
MRRKTAKLFDRIQVAHNKDFASLYRHKNYQKYLHDLVVKNTAELLQSVKKEFKSVAFVGSNPEAFLNYLPSSIVEPLS